MGKQARAEEGRRILITGASRGIGRATALAAARRGYQVALLARSTARLSEVSEEIRRSGGRVLQIVTDVTRPTDLQRASETIAAEWGALDALVNNAGIARRQSFSETELADWEQVIETNLTAPFLVTKAFYPLLKRGWQPAIVNVASIAGRIGGKVGPHYGASKAGLIALTRYLAGDLKGDGIRANCVAPDLTDTDMLDDIGLRSAAHAGRPNSGPGHPDEVARTILFLAQANMPFLNGECVHLTGGKQYYD